jgi:MFS transporter, DHA1 family, multidrug resistance protein
MSPPSHLPHSPERPHAHHATPKWLLALLLAALGMLGPFAVDTYIPAFPTIAADLGATTLQMQQTFSVYLFAFAFMFLFHGALSDSFGRKPVILGGLVVFFIASVGCAMSTTISQLLFWRALQGLSVGAGMVVGRAMVRDLYGDVDAQRIMSMVTLWFGIAPAIAPILGGFLYTGLGWHSIFWFIAAFTLVLILLSARVIHETLPHERRQPFKPGPLVEGYRQVGANAPLILLSLAAGFNFNGFFLYILSAPIYLPEQLGLGPTEYAWLFAPGIGGIMLGAFISGRVAGKWKPEKTIRAGYMIMLVAASINVAYAFTGKPSLPWAVIPIGFYAVGSALAFPSLSIMVMNLFPSRRGMATSLSGFITGMVNVLVAGLISPALSHSHLWLSIGMASLMVTGFACWYSYRRLTSRTHHANVN